MAVTLDLDLTSSLPAGIDLNRDSTATYADGLGHVLTVAADLPRFEAAGLLIEGPATNVALQSGDLTAWTTAAVASGQTAPDNVGQWATVTRLAAGTQQYVEFADGATVTGSVFAARGNQPWAVIELFGNNATTSRTLCYNFDTGQLLNSPNTLASVRDLGAGVVRLSLTFADTGVVEDDLAFRTAATNLVPYGGTAGMWGAQLETGKFASSYIPTTATTASRIGDLATLTSIGSWYNAAEGTFYVELTTGNQPNLAATAVSFGVSDGTFNNTTYISHSVTADALNVLSGAVSQCAAQVSGTQTTAKRVVAGYKANDFGVSRNGGTVITDTAGTPSVAPTSARIGSAPWTTASYLYGHISRITYYDTKLTNTEIRQLSAIPAEATGTVTVTTGATASLGTRVLPRTNLRTRAALVKARKLIATEKPRRIVASGQNSSLVSS